MTARSHTRSRRRHLHRLRVMEHRRYSKVARRAKRKGHTPPPRDEWRERERDRNRERNLAQVTV